MNGRKRRVGVFIVIVLDSAWIVLGTVFGFPNCFSPNVILGRKPIARHTIMNMFSDVI